jgi:hypothetical protein
MGWSNGIAAWRLPILKRRCVAHVCVQKGRETGTQLVFVDEALRPGPGLRWPAEEPELSECEEWLRATLAGGPVLAGDLRCAGREAGFAGTTLRRARSRIGAVIRREGFGPGSKYYWQERNAPKHEPACTAEIALA